MIVVYNGQTGSLGAYRAAAVQARAADGVRALALRSRLEERAKLREELDALAADTAGGARAGERVLLVQLAARVSVPACERDPDGAFRTNVTDTAATVEEICRWADARQVNLTILYISSGHVFAQQPAGRLVREEDPVAPRSVYARTKLEAEGRLAELARAAGRPLTVARVFGLIAPKQPAGYLLPGLIRRVTEEQLVGIPGLSFFRDYLDARDVCQILLELGERRGPPHTLVNVCSGQSVRLRDLLEEIARAMKPARADALLAQATEAPARPDDIPWIVGDPARLTAALGRPAPRRALAETVADAGREAAR
jgi:nucleoside-diphosphate-sugar epimerase